MSGFCVYGRSRQVAIERAKNKVATYEGKRPLSESECMEKVRALAEEKFLSMKPVKVTQEFDAPQFAEEFIALVERCNTPDLASLKIMCQGTKTKVDGAPMLNKDGKPKTGWIPYVACPPPGHGRSTERDSAGHRERLGNLDESAAVGA